LVSPTFKPVLYHGKIDGTFGKHASQTGSCKFGYVLFMETKIAATFLKCINCNMAVLTPENVRSIFI